MFSILYFKNHNVLSVKANQMFHVKVPLLGILGRWHLVQWGETFC